jgi:hypothetical protein
VTPIQLVTNHFPELAVMSAGREQFAELPFSLPAEIWGMIFDSLEDDELYQLGWVSRGLRGLSRDERVWRRRQCKVKVGKNHPGRWKLQCLPFIREVQFCSCITPDDGGALLILVNAFFLCGCFMVHSDSL